MAVSKIIEILFKVRGAGEAGSKTKGLDDKLKNLGKTALKTGIAVVGINKALGFVKKSAEMAGQLEGITQGFDNLSKKAGMGADTLDKLTEATDGTMSRMELMELANNAMLLGIADSSDQMGEMFDIAQRLGKSLGKDTRFGVESLVTGMGRQSKLMLDNIGIMVDIDKANEKYAESLGKTVKELTEQEKKQAFNNEVIAQGRDLVSKLGAETLTTKDKMQQLKVASEETTVQMGELFVPAVEAVTSALTKATTATFNWLTASGKANEIADRQNAIAIRQSEILVETARKVAEARKTAKENNLDSIAEGHLLNQVNEHTANSVSLLANSYRDLNTPILANQEIVKQQVKAVDESNKSWLSMEQQGAIKITQMLSDNLANAVIHGQDFGDAMKSSLKAIAIEMMANATMFLLLQSITGGAFAGTAQGAGGLAGFLLKGFTGQTPTVNNNINISGGLVSDSYVRNTLSPALNRVRAFG